MTYSLRNLALSREQLPDFARTFGLARRLGCHGLDSGHLVSVRHRLSPARAGQIA